MVNDAGSQLASLPARWPPGHGRRYARPGSMYAALLMTALIVSVIGLSGLAATRIQLRSVAGVNNATAARFYAQSALDMGLFAVSNDADWRTTYSHDVWVSEQPLGEGTYTWKLVDEQDGDLATNPAGPVRLYGKGIAGDAVRVYSVQVQPETDGTSDPNLLANGDMEDGVVGWMELGDCDLERDTDEPHGGLACLKVKGRHASSDGPYNGVVPDAFSDGENYDTEIWVKMKDSPEDVLIVVYWRTTTGWYRTEAARTSVGTTWTRVNGTFTASWFGTLLQAYWKIETGWSKQEFKIDDAVLEVAGGALAGDTTPTPVSGTWRQEVEP